MFSFLIANRAVSARVKGSGNERGNAFNLGHIRSAGWDL
jgi:hypothetical protein